MRVEIRHHRRVIRGELAYPKMRTGKLPAVVVVHGRTVDRDYPPLLPLLRQELRRVGYVMLAIDLAGHGQSSGKFANLTYTRAAEDVEAAVRFLARQPKVNPFAVGGIGHSLGGTAIFLARHRGALLKTLVLLAPVGDTVFHLQHRYSPAVVRSWRRKKVMELWYSKRAKRTFALRFSFYADFKRHDTLRSARHIHQPVLIIHGSLDKNVAPIESRRLFHALHEPKRLVIIPRAQHNFNEPSQLRIVISEVREWLREYLAKRTSAVVNVFIRHHDRYLILKRSNQVSYYRGKWAIVSGHSVKGVPFVEQAFSEAYEEAGLKRRQLKVVKIGKKLRRYDRALDKTWLITPILMESSSRRVKLDWEHTAYRWVRLKDFPVAKSYPGIENQFVSLGLR